MFGNNGSVQCGTLVMTKLGPVPRFEYTVYCIRIIDASTTQFVWNYSEFFWTANYRNQIVTALLLFQTHEIIIMWKSLNLIFVYVIFRRKFVLVFNTVGLNRVHPDITLWRPQGLWTLFNCLERFQIVKNALKSNLFCNTYVIMTYTKRRFNDFHIMIISRVWNNKSAGTMWFR